MTSQDHIEFLVDRTSSGQDRPWANKKAAVMQLAQVYDALGSVKADRLRDCATLLAFSSVIDTGALKLVSMSSCRVRLCPMCAWRRSLKIFASVSKVMDIISCKDYAYLFITLTAKNCNGDELSSSIDMLFTAWHSLLHRKCVKIISKGWYRSLEVTHNVNVNSSSYDTYHPHFHCIIVVNKSYFTDPMRYISHEKWVSMWRECLGVDYDPIVDVRRVKGDASKAVAEISKYAVKDKDYVLPDNWDLSMASVAVLDVVLANRRLVAYGGVMRDVRRQLRLDDEIDGDLVNVDVPNDDQLSDEIIYYAWHVGYSQYIRC